MSVHKLNPEILYERLLKFAKRCQKLISKLPNNPYNDIYGKQLLRSSSSPGSNYIEAVEAFSKKDFIHKLKICRKESKESTHWLKLIKSSNSNLKDIGNECAKLNMEAREFIKIFSSSIRTTEINMKSRNGK
jgi:four helix bundle protein